MPPDTVTSAPYNNIQTTGPVIEIPIHLDGIPLKALIDCGARISIGGRDLIKKITSHRIRCKHPNPQGFIYKARLRAAGFDGKVKILTIAIFPIIKINGYATKICVSRSGCNG